MDHARKIGKTKAARLWDRKYSATDVRVLPGEEINVNVENRCLGNWKRWLADRERNYRYFSSVTGRKKEDLVMNSCETFRPQVEMQSLIEAAALLPSDSAKRRTDCSFWTTPAFLPNRRHPSVPEIAAAVPKKAHLTRIAQPELIQNEKSLHLSKSTKFPWERNEYLRTRMKELRPNICAVEPKEPEMDQLAVRGHGLNYMKSNKSYIKNPVIIVSGPEPEESPAFDPDDAMVLIIQHRELVFDESSISRQEDKEIYPITFSLIFEGQVGEEVEQKIVFENKGVYAITYKWYDDFRRPKVFPPARRVRGSFIFNKNTDIILPGQIVTLCVWYNPEDPGAYAETWRLDTEPKISYSPIIFRFWGCCDDPESSDQSVDEYLDSKIRDSVIEEIITDILDNIQTEGDIFMAKNPDYIYYPHIVKEFRKIYEETTEDNLSSSWSLSLAELRDTLLRVDDLDRRNEMLEKFCGLCRESLKTSFYSSTMNTKYLAAYNLLCSFVNNFQAESELVKTHCLGGTLPVLKLEEAQHRVPESSAVMSRASQTSNSRTSNVKSNRTIKSSQRISHHSESLTMSPATSQESLTSQGLKNTMGNVFDHSSYKEIFYSRIYSLLSDTIEQICLVIDWQNDFNEQDT